MFNRGVFANNKELGIIIGLRIQKTTENRFIAVRI